MIFHRSLPRYLSEDLERIQKRAMRISLPDYNKASDRVRQKMGNSVAFSREIMRQERSIMRQIVRFF